MYLRARTIAKLIKFISTVVLAVFFTVFQSGCKKDTAEADESNPEVQFVKIPKATIACKIYGSGDPVIMCMGYASNMDMWSTEVIELLKKKFKIIVFDYRGMGFSTNADTTMTIGTLADDVNALIDSLHLAKTHILGWSMGGYVAQMFAIKHPEKVKKLVLYATNAGDTLAINPSQEIIDILSNPGSTPEELLGTLFPDDWLLTHAEPWEFLPDGTEPYNGDAIGMQYDAIQKWLNPLGGSSGRLHKLKMPVLIICGNQDKVVPCVNSTILSDSISSSTLIKIPESGHGLMYQLPDVFTNYVLSFLTE